MQDDTKFKLRVANREELAAFNKDLVELIAKHGAELRTVPKFVPDGMSFKVDADVMLFKKIELVEKETEDVKPEPAPQVAAGVGVTPSTQPAQA